MLGLRDFFHLCVRPARGRPDDALIDCGSWTRPRFTVPLPWSGTKPTGRLGCASAWRQDPRGGAWAEQDTKRGHAQSSGAASPLRGRQAPTRARNRIWPRRRVLPCVPPRLHSQGGWLGWRQKQGRVKRDALSSVLHHVAEVSMPNTESAWPPGCGGGGRWERGMPTRGRLVDVLDRETRAVGLPLCFTLVQCLGRVECRGGGPVTASPPAEDIPNRVEQAKSFEPRGSTR